MKKDIKIAQETQLQSIYKVAERLEIPTDAVELYGNVKAKVDPRKVTHNRNGKLVLVTAINPTPAGEGKTTTNIGLSMALNQLGHSAISVLREPSMGPCFGMKGGATGGGYAQVLPMEDINLHFTGDFHAITAAHNLLAALVDNHIYHGNELDIDPHHIVFKRVMDMNDRALRRIEVAQDGLRRSIPHASGFDITVASEIMAILCLSHDMEDLKIRLGKIVVAYDTEGNEVCAHDLNAVGAMALLLKEAIKPNLVQTSENTPALIHGGPFANIAHGCNSIIATQLGMRLADFAITEAGFGADLGAEKFFNIKMRQSGIKPNAVVLVATIRALKYNGHQKLKNIEQEDIVSLKNGIVNLTRHYENLKQFGVPIVVAINIFPTDTEREISCLQEWSKQHNVDVSLSYVHAKGGKGALDLAQKVVDLCTQPTNFKLLYEDNASLKSKIETIASKIYHAKRVEFSEEALVDLELYEHRYAHFSVCMAKTAYSFSDDPTRLGAPSDFTLHINEIRLSKGAGFVVCITGDIMTMPGLPKVPAAEGMNVLENGTIVGLS